MKLLLGRKDVNLNTLTTTITGRTPLIYAAMNGHEGIMKLLLGQEHVDPDIPDKQYGQTALSWAARMGTKE